jgi:hypothetical protein
MSVRAIAAVASLGICGLLAPPAAAQLPQLPPAPLPPAPLPPAPLPPAPLPINPPALLPPPPPAPLPPPPTLLPPPPTLLPPPPTLPPASPPAPLSAPASSPSSGSGAGKRPVSGGRSSAPRTGSAAQPSLGAGGTAPDRDPRAGPARVANRARVASTREDERDQAATVVKKRPRVAAGKDSVPEKDDASLVGSIPNPFREAPAWLQPFMIGMAAVALLLLQLGALPVSMIPWPGAAVFVARRRPALVGAGAGLLGALGVASLTL